MNTRAIQNTSSQLSFGLGLGLGIQRFYGLHYPQALANSKICFASHAEFIGCAIDVISAFFSPIFPNKSDIDFPPPLFSKAKIKQLFTTHNAIYWSAMLTLPVLERPLSDDGREDEFFKNQQDNWAAKIAQIFKREKPYPHLHFIAAIVTGLCLLVLFQKDEFYPPMIIISATALQLISTLCPNKRTLLYFYTEWMEQALKFAANPPKWFSLKALEFLASKISEMIDHAKSTD